MVAFPCVDLELVCVSGGSPKALSPRGMVKQLNFALRQAWFPVMARTPSRLFDLN